MRKVLILVLAAFMLLMLSGCDNRNNRDQNNIIDDVIPTPMNNNVTPGVNGNDLTGNNNNVIGDNGNVNDTQNGTNANNIGDSSTLVGAISEITGRTIVITPDAGQNITGDRISVTVDYDHNFMVGDRVRVTYSGNTTGTDPVTVNASDVQEID